jgi:hypothetical protein
VPSPVAKYALENNLGKYLDKLKPLDKVGKSEIGDNEKAFIDLLAANSTKVNQLVPSLYDELLLLPELSSLDEREIKALARILKLAGDPAYTRTFESILDEGIPGKRKFCTPLLLTLYLAATQGINMENLLNNYSPENLWEELGRSAEWKQFSLSHLSKFEDAIDMFNSPVFPYLWLKDNITYKYDFGPGEWSTAKELFTARVGDCEDYATFITYALLHNGWYFDDFDKHDDYAACSLIIARIVGDPSKDEIVNKVNKGEASSMRMAEHHFVTLVKRQNKVYCYDATLWDWPRGPYKGIREAADKLVPQWSIYGIAGGEPYSVPSYPNIDPDKYAFRRN